MNDSLLIEIEAFFCKKFFKRLIKAYELKYNGRYCDYQITLDSNIVELHGKLFYKIKPIIWSGLKQNAVERISMPDALNSAYDFVLQNYPVYNMWINIEIEHYIDNYYAIISAFEKDKDEISKMLGLDNVSTFCVKMNLGDKHRGGKSVALLEFNTGEKILYKPRNLSIDSHFSELLEFIKTETNTDFRCPQLILRDSYGWVEYIDYKSCSTQTDIINFYYRLGCLLCILYSLEATDFHYENIISHGSYPVLIDLESFFHPYKPIDGMETNQGIDQSVLRTGILPNEVTINNIHTVDMGGLSNLDNTESLLPTSIYEYHKDGTFAVKRITQKLNGGKNIPILNGQKRNIDNYLCHFVNGFKNTYTFIIKNKAKYLQVIAIFKNDNTRVLFRNTFVYTHLLTEANNINILKSTKKLQEHFQLLKEVIPDYSIAERFVEYEINDLWKRDIPLFTTKVNSRNLWYTDTDCIRNFFKETGFETVIAKINRMSINDLYNQIWIINTSLKLKQSLIINNKNSFKYKPNNRFLNNRIIKVINNVKKHLYRNIHALNDDVLWLVVQAQNVEANKYKLVESSYDLFSGMPGEILFLSYYGKIYNDTFSSEIAKKAYEYLIRKVKISSQSIKPLGLYAGWGSLIYLNTELYAILSDDMYLRNNEELICKINFKELIDKDTNYGLIKGAAGFICACLNYYEYSQSQNALTLAIYAADTLLKKVVKMKTGIGWQIFSDQPLAGLGHGASGFIVTFCKLYKITKNEYYIEIIFELLKYENSLYSSENGNWKDVRKSIRRNGLEDIYTTAWSHGAGGIGLARIELLQSGINSEMIINDLNNALKCVLNNGLKYNMTLSFGSLGNMELLINYLQYNYDNHIYDELVKRYDYITQYLLVNKLKINETGVISLGLMTGITGIGYQMLRYLFPDKVKSILLI